MLAASLLGLGWASTALCEETDTPSRVWINLGGVSWHLQNNNERNGENPGLGIEYVLDEKKSLVAGVYKNSFYDYSNYAGMTWMPLELGHARLGLIAAVIDGYHMVNNGRPFPAVMPAMMFETRHHGLNLIFAPPSYGKLHGTIALQYKYRF